LTTPRAGLIIAGMAALPDIPAADDPAATMAAVIALRRLADRLEREAVDLAIERGWTWAQIAQALGVTRQAAHKRHARRPRGRDRGGT
jgi:hypothetical protein